MGFLRWIALLLLPIWARAGTNDGTLLLHNDSTVILTAVIQASDGSYLGQFSVQPGQQRKFTTNMYPAAYLRPGMPDISLTPYTVVWQGPSDELFSMETGVQPGAYVRATWCPGKHYSAPKKELKKEAPPASTLKKKK